MLIIDVASHHKLIIQCNNRKAKSSPCQTQPWESQTSSNPLLSFIFLLMISITKWRISSKNIKHNSCLPTEIKSRTLNRNWRHSKTNLINRKNGWLKTIGRTCSKNKLLSSDNKHLNCLINLNRRHNKMNYIRLK